MRLKTLLENVLMIIFLGAIAFGLYRYLQSPAENQEQTTRYQKNDQENLFEKEVNEGVNLDDCERFVNPVIAQNCIEARTKD